MTQELLAQLVPQEQLVHKDLRANLEQMELMVLTALEFQLVVQQDRFLQRLVAQIMTQLG